MCSKVGTRDHRTLWIHEYVPYRCVSCGEEYCWTCNPEDYRHLRDSRKEVYCPTCHVKIEL